MKDIGVMVISLAFLALPGIIGVRVFRPLTCSFAEKREGWESFLDILLFSLTSYLIYGVALSVIDHYLTTGFRVTVFEKLRGLSSGNYVDVNWFEIAWVSLISVVLAFAAAFCDNRKLINRFGQRIRATRRFGDEDVWEYFHNSKDLDTWVVVRDHKHNLVYFGYIVVYSSTEKDRELIMRDVSIHEGSGGAHLYDASVVYLSIEQFDLNIEILDSLKERKDGKDR